MLSTRTFNFAPDAFESERIQKASQGNRDASGDLAYRDILYDAGRAMWVRVPEADFDRRRTYNVWGE
jgi:hypothetical protein